MEHFPPRSAFNRFPVLERYIRQETERSARIVPASRQYRAGLYSYSLCQDCNNRLVQYDLHYTPFVREVAERVARVGRPSASDTVQVQVLYPLRVLKCVLKSFVSANGSRFVGARPWIRRFLLDRFNTEWDPKMRLYLYACATRGREAKRRSRSARFRNRTSQTPFRVYILALREHPIRCNLRHPPAHSNSLPGKSLRLQRSRSYKGVLACECDHYCISP
jgi:hypothetical protein